MVKNKLISPLHIQKMGVLSLFFISLFLGLGSGTAVKKRIENSEIKMSHTISFSDNVSKPVKIIGQNSGYLFYLAEGEKNISITPMGQVKEIQNISEK